MVVTALRVAELCKVLVSALAVTSEALLAVTVYSTCTPASSRRCLRATAVTVRSVTVLPAGSTVNTALVKAAWNWGESVTPEMVWVTLMITTAAVGAAVEGAPIATGDRDRDGTALVSAGEGGVVKKAAVVGCVGCTVGS